MQIDQVRTLVSGSSLKERKRTSTRACLTAAHFLFLSYIQRFGIENAAEGGPPSTYHYANVVPVVAGQGSIHLKQVMLRPQEAVQVMRMEAHHQTDVIQPAERKGVLEYRLRSGVHFADLKDLLGGKKWENWETLLGEKV